MTQLKRITYEGGHPELSKKIFGDLKIASDAIVFTEAWLSEALFKVPVRDITNIRYDTSENITLGRMVLLGLGAFAFKKKTYYLVIDYKSPNGIDYQVVFETGTNKDLNFLNVLNKKREQLIIETSNTFSQSIQSSGNEQPIDQKRAIVAGSPESLLKRGYLFLEDEDFDVAREYFDTVLDIDPERSEAYFGKLLAELKYSHPEDIISHRKPITQYKDYKKAIHFAPDDLRVQYERYNQHIEDLLEEEKAAQERLVNRILSPDTKVQRFAYRWKTLVLLTEVGYVLEIEIGDKLNIKNRLNSSEWKDIVQIATGLNFIVGLKPDGSIVTSGNFAYPINHNLWQNIKALSGNWSIFAGLKNDGTVIIHQTQYSQTDLKVSIWKSIVDISVGVDHIVGLNKWGAVLTKCLNSDLNLDTSHWRNMIAVSAGDSHTVGLKNDGTVLAVGKNDFGQLETKNWKNITAIAAGDNHTAGLMDDGSVVAVGQREGGKLNTEDWTDIIAIAAGENTVGLRKDGMLLIGDANESVKHVLSKEKVKVVLTD